jgi:hypothetical protein
VQQIARAVPLIVGEIVEASKKPFLDADHLGTKGAQLFLHELQRLAGHDVTSSR